MISFIIPTYNEEKVIAETVKRLRTNFSLTAYEIIIADDNSTDKTVEIAKALVDKVVIGPKSTIAANRNRGAAVAKFPFLVFFDSGVEIPKPNDFFTLALKDFSEDGRLVGLGVKIKIDPKVKTLADTFFNWLLDSWFAFANNVLGWGLSTGKFHMMRASAFKQLGGYDEKLAAGEDNELFSRLSRIGRTHFEGRLTIFHLGRREHALGWPKLLAIWGLNALFVLFFKRSFSKQWKAIR